MMTKVNVRSILARTGLLAIGVALGICSSASAQQAPPARGGNLTQPVYRVPRQERVAANLAVAKAAPAAPAAQPAHPLVPAIQLAKKSLANIDMNVKDYTATLIKRENINGTLSAHEYMYLKVRHAPFSAYMYFLSPAKTKGRECLYVNGQYDDNLVAHEGPSAFITRTVHLDPKGFLAMRGQRYPITEVGIRTLTARLVEVAENDMRIGGQCEVKWYKGTKIGKGDKARTCTCLQVIHPVKKRGYRFHSALVFIDDELQVPIRYQAFQFPRTAGGKPVLDEEYTYMNLKINPGLTNVDFDKTNPKYNF